VTILVPKDNPTTDMSQHQKNNPVMYKVTTRLLASYLTLWAAMSGALNVMGDFS
jgi:hypothetical protein